MVQNINITVSEENFDDYICITDIAKAKAGESRGADVVKNWMRNRATLEFLGTWEQIYLLWHVGAKHKPGSGPVMD